MNKITIGNLEEPDMTRLTKRAESQDRSVEEEARAILLAALTVTDGSRGLGPLIHERFKTAGGVNLPPERRRQPNRKPYFSD